jgi:hypothetical protein
MFKLDKDRMVLGRGEKADIRLLDDGLAREHAQLTKRGTEVVLEDLGSTNGTYCNGERVERRSLAEGDKILLGSTTILRFTYQDRLDEAFQRQMSESALRDGLTHAYNKRTFIERLEAEFQYALRHDAPVSLIFLDIDHFKRINDVHGHLAGDTEDYRVPSRPEDVLNSTRRKSKHWNWCHHAKAANSLSDIRMSGLRRQID